MLELLHLPAEIDQGAALRGIGRLEGIAGHHPVGQPAHADADREQVAVLERLVAAAEISRLGKLHVLTGQQLLHRPGLKRRQGRPVEVAGRILVEDIATGLRDEAGEECRDPLPLQLGVIVIVEDLHPDQGRHHDRHTPDLPAALRPEDVDHLLGRHADVLARVGSEALVLAGMLPQEVIGNPSSDGVELDPASDLVPASIDAAVMLRQHLGFEKLKLQRHRQPVIGAAITDPDEYLAGLEDRPGDRGLQPVEVADTVSIGFVRPGQPCRLDALLLGRVVHDRRRHDARSDGLRFPGIRRGRRIGVVEHRIPAALEQPLAIGPEQAVDGRAARLPGAQPAVTLRGVEGDDIGALPRGGRRHHGATGLHPEPWLRQ